MGSVRRGDDESRGAKRAVRSTTVRLGDGRSRDSRLRVAGGGCPSAGSGHIAVGAAVAIATHTVAFGIEATGSAAIVDVAADVDCVAAASVQDAEAWPVDAEMPDIPPWDRDMAALEIRLDANSRHVSVAALDETVDTEEADDAELAPGCWG